MSFPSKVSYYTAMWMLIFIMLGYICQALAVEGEVDCDDIVQVVTVSRGGITERRLKFVNSRSVAAAFKAKSSVGFTLHLYDAADTKKYELNVTAATREVEAKYSSGLPLKHVSFNDSEAIIAPDTWYAYHLTWSTKQTLPFPTWHMQLRINTILRAEISSPANTFIMSRPKYYSVHSLKEGDMVYWMLNCNQACDAVNYISQPKDISSDHYYFMPSAYDAWLRMKPTEQNLNATLRLYRSTTDRADVKLNIGANRIQLCMETGGYCVKETVGAFLNVSHFTLFWLSYVDGIFRFGSGNNFTPLVQMDSPTSKPLRYLSVSASPRSTGSLRYYPFCHRLKNLCPQSNCTAACHKNSLCVMNYYNGTTDCGCKIPCQNNGTCEMTSIASNTAACVCPVGFSGYYCEITGDIPSVLPPARGISPYYPHPIKVPPVKWLTPQDKTIPVYNICMPEYPVDPQACQEAVVYKTGGPVYRLWGRLYSNGFDASKNLEFTFRDSPSLKAYIYSQFISFPMKYAMYAEIIITFSWKDMSVPVPEKKWVTITANYKLDNSSFLSGLSMSLSHKNRYIYSKTYMFSVLPLYFSFKNSLDGGSLRARFNCEPVCEEMIFQKERAAERSSWIFDITPGRTCVDYFQVKFMLRQDEPCQGIVITLSDSPTMSVKYYSINVKPYMIGLCTVLQNCSYKFNHSELFLSKMFNTNYWLTYRSGKVLLGLRDDVVPIVSIHGSEAHAVKYMEFNTPSYEKIYFSVNCWANACDRLVCTGSCSQDLRGRHFCQGCFLKCQNGGQCKIENGLQFCKCPMEYTGMYCEVKSNYCLLYQPCKHWGLCHSDDLTSYTCTCTEHWVGKNCSEEKNYCQVYTPCLNGGTCTRSFGRFNCTCNHNYTGAHCDEEVNFCLSNPCQNGSTCRRRLGEYNCVCAEGYAGQQCQNEKMKNATLLQHDSAYYPDDVTFVFCVTAPGTNNKLQWNMGDGHLFIAPSIAYYEHADQIIAAAGFPNASLPKDVKYVYIYNHSYTTSGQFSVEVSIINDGITIQRLGTPINITKHPLFCVPDVKIQNSGLNITHAPSYQMKNGFVITSIMRVPCTDVKMLFNWILYLLTEELPFPTEKNILDVAKQIHMRKKYLSIPPYVLPYGKYSVAMQVTVEIEVGNITNSAWGWFSIITSPVEARLVGGTSKSAVWNSPLVVDASPSVDPNLKHYHDNLEFTWFCWPNNTAVVDPVCQEKIPLNHTGVTLTLPARALQENTWYVFQVKVKSRSNETKPGLAKQFIKVESRMAAVATVSCVKNCEQVSIPTDHLLLKGGCENCDSKEDVVYKWEMIPHKENKRTKIDWTAETESGQHNQLLQIPAGILHPGDSYTFRLEVSQSAFKSAFAELSIRMNSPPQGGSCSATPVNGTALVTKFNITCTEFQDIDQPLEYRFYYVTDLDDPKQDGALLYYEINPSLRNTTLSQGLEIYNHKAIIRIQICDILGTCANEKLNLYVFPLSSEVKEEESRVNFVQELVIGTERPSKLKELMAAGDIQGALQLKESVLDVMNMELEPDPEKEKQEKKVKKRALIRTTIVEALEEVPLHSVLAVLQTSQRLQQVLKGRKEEIEDVASERSSHIISNMGTSLEERLSELGDQVTTQDLEHTSHSIIRAGSKLLQVTHHPEVTPTVLTPMEKKLLKERDYLYESSQTDMEQQQEWQREQERAKKLQLNKNITDNTLAALDKVGKTLLQRKIKGEHETTLKAHNMVLWVKKHDVSDINNTAFGTSDVKERRENSVEIPISEIMRDQQTESLSVQLLHTSENPFWWHPMSSAVNSHTVSITLRNDTGKKMNIQNLSEPVHVFLNRSEDSFQIVDGLVKVLPYWAVKDGDISVHVLTVPENKTIQMVLTPAEDVKLLVVVTKKYKPELSDLFAKGITIPSDDLKGGKNLSSPYFIQVPFDISNNDSQAYFVGILPHPDTVQTYLNITEEMVVVPPAAFPQNVSTTYPSVTSPDAIDGDNTLSALLGFIPAVFKEHIVTSREEMLNKFPKYTINYTLSVFTSTCLFWDPERATWMSHGCKTGSLTNKHWIHCQCTHLSFFSGIFFVAPNALDPFKDIHLFLGVVDNPVVVSLVGTLFVLYVLLIIWARKKDIQDLLKRGVIVLQDNDPEDHYAYLITVYTGFRRGSGTTAHVSVQLEGDEGKSEVHVLEAKNRPVLTHGSEDWFLLMTPATLGHLQKLYMWHDNAGKSPSWYCEKVLVRDLQTNQIWFFLAQKWLSVCFGDRSLYRVIEPASGKELLRWTVLFYDRMSHEFRDGHLWFSIFTRHPASTFTRCQRVSAAFCLLMTTMLANIMFYGIPKNSAEYQIEVGNFHVTWTAVIIGIESALISFPVNLLIVTLFRKIRPTRTNLNPKTEYVLSDEEESESQFSIPSHVQINIIPSTPPSHTPAESDSSIKEEASDEIACTMGTEAHPRSICTRYPQVSSHIEIGDSTGEKGKLKSFSQGEIAGGSQLVQDLSPISDIVSIHLSELGGYSESAVEMHEDSQAFLSSHELTGIMSFPSTVSHTDTFVRQRSSTETGVQGEIFMADLTDTPSAKSMQTLFKRSFQSIPSNLELAETVMPDVPARGQGISTEKLRSTLVEDGKKEEAVTEDEVQEVEMLAEVEERQDKKEPFGLPEWFLYIAWTLCTVTTLTCAYFIMLYGLRYGRVRSLMWLSSIVVSIFQSILLQQPLKAALLAWLLSLIIKKPREQEDRCDDVPLEEDEEYLEEEGLKPYCENLARKRLQHMYKPLSEEKVQHLVDKSQTRAKLQSLIWDLVLYSIFLLVTFWVIIGYRQVTNAYYTSHTVVSMLVNADYEGETTLEYVTDQNSMLDFLNNTLIPSLHMKEWYNGDPVENIGWMVDFNTIVLGVPRICQQRVKKGSCTPDITMKGVILTCESTYTLLTEDTANYGAEWTTVNSSSKGFSHTRTPWKYLHMQELRFVPMYGQNTLYSGGGYCAYLGKTRPSSHIVLGYLRNQGWFDEYTRALSVEFLTYNPNTDFFNTVTILLEQEATGGYHTSYKVHPINIHILDSIPASMLGASIVFVIILLIYTYRELRLLVSLKLKYFHDFWKIIQLSVLFLGYATMALVVKCKIAFSEAAAGVTVSQDTLLKLFYSAQFWHISLNHTTAFLLCLVLVSFWKMLLFSRIMHLMYLTITKFAEPLLSLFGMFVVIFFAYAVFAFVTMGPQIFEFKSLYHTCITLLLFSVDAFHFETLADANRLLGPLFYLAFVLIMLFYFMNMFITVVLIGFEEAKRDIDNIHKELNIVDFIADTLFELFAINIIDDKIESLASLDTVDQTTAEGLVIKMKDLSEFKAFQESSIEEVHKMLEQNNTRRLNTDTENDALNGDEREQQGYEHN